MGTTEADLLRRMMAAGEITEGDAARASELAGPDRGAASPGGLFPEQAGILRRLRGGGGDRFEAADELSTLDRLAGRFAGGLQSELTLGRQEAFGAAGGDAVVDREVTDILNKEGLDAGDIADVAGRILGAAPLALATGALARVGAAALSGRLAGRAPGIARALEFVSSDADKAARFGRRVLQGASRNVFEGLAFSAVAGPARRLEEGQSRARAVAQEFGVGAAADFIFGAVLGTGGAGLRNAARAFSESDNSIDREIGTALIRIIDDAEVGGPGAAGQRTSAQVVDRPAEIAAPDELLPLPPGEPQAPPRFRAPETGGAVDLEAPIGDLPARAEAGPILARGEVPSPAELRARDDVDIERNRPFLSRRVQEGDEAVQAAESITEGEPTSVTLFHARAEGRGIDPDEPLFFGTRDTDVIREQGAGPARPFQVEIENPLVVEADNFGNIASGTGSERSARARLIETARENGNDAVVIRGSNAVGEGDEVIVVEPRGRVTDQEGRLIGEGGEAGDALPFIEGTAPEELAATAPPAPEELAVPQVRSRAAREAIDEMSRATDEGELFTAASNLQEAGLSDAEARDVQAFIRQRLQSFQRGAEVPAPARPFDEPPARPEVSETDATPAEATDRPRGTPESVPEPDAEVPAVLREDGFETNPQPLKAAVDQLGEEGIMPLDRAVSRVKELTPRLEEPRARTELESTLEEVDQQYGIEVGDRVRVRNGLNPEDMEPTLAAQATALRHADAAATAFREGEALQGAQGAPAPVSTPSGQLSASYRVVDLDDVVASHSATSWQPDPDYYPTGAVQQRDYLRNTANRESVIRIADQPDINSFLDRSSFAQTGPPVLSPDGKAIAGNGRTMALKRMRELNPEGFRAYQEAVRARAAEFGIEGDLPPGGVLVRVLDDDSVDFSDVDQLRELNIEFDKAVGKAKTAIEDAASRASTLESRGSAALRALDESIEPDQTLRAWLWTPDGRSFVRELRQSGVIGADEAGQLIDGDTGFLTERGREVVTETLLVSAVGDADVVRRAPQAIKGRIEHAIPGLVRAKGTEWDLQPVVREALDLHASLAENPQFTGRTGKVANFRGQQDLFGAETSARGLDMAQTIEDFGKRDVTEAFRGYFRELDLARRQGQSDDLFGFEPKTPEQAFSEKFGAARRIQESDRRPCR